MISLGSYGLARKPEVASVLERALTLESLVLGWNLSSAISCLT